MPPMTTPEAKQIVHTVLSIPRAARYVPPLLDEMSELSARGDVVMAQQRARDVEDLAAYFADGHFVGAAEIAEAFRLLAR
mgnify:FL=1